MQCLKESRMFLYVFNDEVTDMVTVQENICIFYSRCPQIFKKSKSHLKILGVRRRV
jgi:hypothetical protein